MHAVSQRTPHKSRYIYKRKLQQKRMIGEGGDEDGEVGGEGEQGGSRKGEEEEEEEEQ